MAGENGHRNGKRRNSTGAGRPAWQRLTKTQRERFLELVRAGADRSQATAEVKAPAGSFRALCRFDPRFEAGYLAAKAEGREPIAEQLRRCLLKRALNPDEQSSRPLEMAMRLWDDEYWQRTIAARLELTGKGGGPIEHQTYYDLEKLTDAELDALHTHLAKATAAVAR